MKKIIAIALVLLTVFAFSLVALAEGNTTTLTTTVPDATYTLNIPADQEITFGATDTNIGNVTVTNSSGFAEGKNLQVALTYDAFKCQEVATEIPFVVVAMRKEDANYSKNINSGDTLNFDGKSDGTVNEKAFLAYHAEGVTSRAERLMVTISSTDWGKALGGDYSSTITFTAEVVSEN